MLGVLLLITYPEIVLGSHAFFYRDAGLFGYPLAYYFRDCFWRGELPLWNPYNGCGIPFLAQWNTLVLYPPSLFYLLLPLPWSMNYFLLGHIFLAALGLYFLANRWFNNRFAASVAGLAFAWNGLSLHFLMWPGNIATLAWMPWVILCVERAAKCGGRKIIIASLVGATQLMTGCPEIILFTWAVAIFFSLLNSFREKIPLRQFFRRLLMMVVLVTALSAAQLLPFLDLLAHGNRDTSFGNDAWSMPPWGIANFLVPLFRQTPSVIGVFSDDQQQWTSSYYPGIGIFALALIAVLGIREPKTKMLSVIAMGGLLLALGPAGLIFPLLKTIFPFLGFIRYPIKFVVVSIFCFPLLAASALTWLDDKEILRSRRLLLQIAAFISASTLVVLAAAYFFPSPKSLWPITWKNGLSRALLLSLILGAIFFRLQSPAFARRIIFSFIILFLLGADIITHAPRQNPTVITRAYEPSPLQMSERPRWGFSRAMLSPDVQSRMEHTAHPNPLNHYLAQRAVLLENCNLLEKIPKINGFFTLRLREEWEVESRLYQSGGLPRLEEFLGVSQVTSSSHLLAWDARTNFMPMATIGQKPIFADDETTLRALASPEFDPRHTVYLPREAERRISATQSGKAEIISSSSAAHEVLLESSSAQPGILVLAQAYYHLWKPYVDEKPTSLLRANYAYQAVEIPAGRHKIRITYEDRNFYFGAIFSIATLLGSIGSLFFLRNGKGRTILSRPPS